ncbi:unnamed protein product [marine sediment metagenome]|uniref:Uncharacterized protein n=1 Tax=marine sediment metagenome TaxID=412755 RepID=X1CPZ6_9ZZZZ
MRGMKQGHWNRSIVAVAGALFVPSKDKEIAGVLQKEVPELRG